MIPAMSTARLSVVIPTLNAGATLRSCLAALSTAGRPELPAEIIVVDGGSEDDTMAVATAAGARVIAAPAGRGPQLAEGGRAARGDWLLFLHADTLLSAGWEREVAAFMAAPENAGRAAVFRFALRDADPAARRLERIVAWRCRVLSLPYGDQGLLIGRDFYDRLSGFKPLPLMEDVDIVRRIGRRRLTMLAATATTSAARYRHGGYVRRSARNLACLSLYFLGVPPATIARIYG